MTPFSAVTKMKMMRVADVCRIYGLKPGFVNKYVKTGELPSTLITASVTPGGRGRGIRLFKPSDVEQFIEEYSREDEKPSPGAIPADEFADCRGPEGLYDFVKVYAKLRVGGFSASDTDEYMKNNFEPVYVRYKEEPRK